MKKLLSNFDHIIFIFGVQISVQFQSLLEIKAIRLNTSIFMSFSSFTKLKHALLLFIFFLTLKIYLYEHQSWRSRLKYWEQLTKNQLGSKISSFSFLFFFISSLSPFFSFFSLHFVSFSLLSKSLQRETKENGRPSLLGLLSHKLKGQDLSKCHKIMHCLH